MAQNLQNPDSDFEGHLRNLILSNPRSQSSVQTGNASSFDTPGMQVSQQYPKTKTEQVRQAQTNPPLATQDSNATPPELNPVQPSSTYTSSKHVKPRQLNETGETTTAKTGIRPGLSPQLSPSHRKRPNQSQRRQLHSQLSIPVDSKPNQQGFSLRDGLSSAPGFPSSSSSRWSRSPGYPPPVRQQGPQSAPLNGGQYSQSQPSPQNQGHSLDSPLPPHMRFQRGAGHSPVQQAHLPSPLFSGSRDQSGLRSAELLEAGSPWRGPRQHPGPQNGESFSQRGPPRTAQLYEPVNSYRPRLPDQAPAQAAYLEDLLNFKVLATSVNSDEAERKESFRATVEQICREAIATIEHEHNEAFDPRSVQLACFGSMASGFATKASDMDLALLSTESSPSPDASESPIPRLLEKCLLDNGYGARLLTRTRVPIIKLCERPTPKLRADLLEERSKWENSFADNDAKDASSVVMAENQADSPENKEEHKILSEEKADQEINKSPEKLYQDRLNSLHQGPAMSLGDYYGCAKRLLNKLGGRDMTMRQATDSPKQTQILLDICKRFVDGLSSKDLKERLQKYRSLDFEDQSILTPTTRRSLIGIYTQMEGENLAMHWDIRPLGESTPALEYSSNTDVENWRTLQDLVFIETSQYNKQLHNALERLKKICSLQIMFLEQNTHEPILQYYERTARLLGQLGIRDEPNESNIKLDVAISHYVSGVNSAKLRNDLVTIIAPSPLMSLNRVSLHHAVLQLIVDYELALTQNTYSNEDQECVQEYIKILQDGISKSLQSPSPLIHIKIETASTVAKIQTLPDPTQTNKFRDKYSDHLEFRGIDDLGIQCDINFSAHLALENTTLMRCYSLTDVRVKPFILFVKHWAKTRSINTPYRGTLSSYGYVIMALHYLINIANPFVCPNLQHLRRDPNLPPKLCLGYNVQFWRNEKEIASLAERGLLNHNKDSIGMLLRGFFEYYATNSITTTTGRPGFDWMRDVISLRTAGGLVPKTTKGWTGARTVVETNTEAAPVAAPAAATDPSTRTAAIKSNASLPVQTTQPRKLLATKEETKEIRHRYLFAIEDPFEIDHNVARTVTHNGIVSIRDEFRRAWRIIRAAGGPRGRQQQQQQQEEDLLEENKEVLGAGKKMGVKELIAEIHGTDLFDDEGKKVGRMAGGEVVLDGVTN